MLRILREEVLQSDIRSREIFLRALRLCQHEIGGRARRCIRILRDDLLIIRHLLRAREQPRRCGILPLGIKSITGKTDGRKNGNDEKRRDFLVMFNPENLRFDFGVASGRRSSWHNSMSILGAVGGTARASSYATRNFPAQDRHTLANVFSGDKILDMNAIYNFCAPILGLGVEPKDLTLMQISLRGIIVFLATLIMIRVGHKRSLARKTAFDAVLIVILASVLSRAINGSAAFFATLGGSFVIVMVHRLLAFIAYYSHGFGVLIKGRPELIIDDGDLILSTMRRNHISKHDVEEDIRLAAKTENLDEIRKGYVERSGDISFIERD
jgi:hypothetical protein